MKQKPIDALTEMNDKIFRKRRRPARVRDYTKSVERFYNAQLQLLIRQMTNIISSEVMQILKIEKGEYLTIDTMDSWSDRIIAALESISETLSSDQFNETYERIAQRTLSLAESESTKAFVDSVNKAVGVDLSPMLSESGMADYLNVANNQNVSLIKSVKEEHFSKIENAVIGGIRNGESPTTIAKKIQSATGATKKRAALIARDQTAKLTSEITERRQRQAGIDYYRAVDSGDVRVSGRPGGKYPKAKISCWGIARQDIGYGPGVYKWSDGASWGGEKGLHPGRHHVNCRCTASPVFDWEIKNVK